MQQFTFLLKDMEDIRQRSEEVRQSAAYREAAQVLCILLDECWDTERVLPYLAALREGLPAADVVGITNQSSHLEEEYRGRETVVTIFCFGHPSYELFHQQTATRKEFLGAAHRIHEVLEQRANVRGVLLFAAGFSAPVDDFVEIASVEEADYAFFGAKAAARYGNGEFGQLPETYLFYEGAIYESAMLCVIFSGEYLSIRTQYNLGWHPIGKSMSVKMQYASEEIETVGRRAWAVETIDGIPAPEIYKKYLGLTEGQMSVANTCEFPFLIDRKGVPVARTISSVAGSKVVEFASIVRPGETVRLSYGCLEDIYGETEEDSDAIRAFDAQGIFLVACLNRLLFMGEKEQREIDYYQRYYPQAAVLHGFGEIHYDSNGGGDLNSALISVAFREEEDKTGRVVKGVLPNSTLHSHDGEHSEADGERIRTYTGEAEMQVPLETRLLTFLGQTTRELVQYAEEAQAANLAKSAFLSNVSHEIRSPIHAILGLDEMILNQAENEDIKHLASDLQNAANTLLSLVNDLLDTTRLESGRMEIIPEEYEPAKLIRELYTLTAVKAQEKGLKFWVEADAEIPKVLYGDDTRIRQCAVNILTNAVKYTESGSVILRISAEPSQKDEVGLTISVSDTGIGIKKEDMDKLTRPFERIEEGRNRGIEGTGLGMSIVSQLLSLMDSKLCVESTYGEGSTFSFIVSQGVKSQEGMGDWQEASRADERAAEGFVAPEAHILVVDDTEVNRTVFCGLLRGTQVQIDTAESGKEALVLTRENAYDILFLDQRMPGMDGCETLTAIRGQQDGRNQKTPAVAFSANNDPGTAEFFAGQGFDAFLTKPIRGEVLEQAVLTFLPTDKVKRGERKADAGQEDVAAKARRTFALSGADYGRKIRAALDEGDWKNYTIYVHAIKGSARMIGEEEIAAEAERLERLGDAGDVEGIVAGTPAFLRDFEGLTAAMQSEMEAAEASGDGDKEEISGELLSQAYSAVLEFVEAYDYDSADDVIAMIAESRLPEQERECFARIRTAEELLDGEEVARLIKERMG